MPGATVPSPALPEWAWRQPEVRDALRRRDVGALFKAAQKYAGASQGKIATAVGMLQGRVSEIQRGIRGVSTLDSFERVADGLGMPDDARMILGLAPAHPAGLDHLGASGRAEVIAVYPSQSVARTEIEACAGNAGFIDVLAVRGLGIIGMNDSLLRCRITRATAVRVLLLDPDGRAAFRRAAEIDETHDSFVAGIRLTLARLNDLSSEGVDVQAHVYDMLPTWRVIGADSTLFVSAFGENHEGHTSPMYKITGSPHGSLHRGFRRFVDELRRNSRRVV